jgi:glutamine synthetase
VRVPRLSPNRTQAVRAELRCPDPACNPYLAFAVMLKAGLDGVKRRLPLPEPAEEDLFHVDPRARGFQMLPPSLGTALDALRDDEVVQSGLGSYIYERFVEAKAREWADYRLHVSSWEVDRYLSTY